MLYPELIIRNDVRFTNVFNLLGKRAKIVGVLNQIIINTTTNDLTFNTSKDKINKISELLEISPTQVYQHIRTLDKLGILIKTSRSTFLVNKTIIEINWSKATKF
jgi:DNA-binding transcriptional ArsR family regulator